MKNKILTLWVCVALVLSACGVTATLTPAPTATNVPSLTNTPAVDKVLYTDASQPVEVRVEDLLKRMTLDEKIGQMTQVEKGSLKTGHITQYTLGSILSGGGGSPTDNSVEGWQAMVAGFQAEALATRLSIPLIYGVDAIHGHNNLKGATIFPHNIGLGATRDAELVEAIGRATAAETLATGIPWNFAPVIAVPQDIRWGRTYEGYGEDTALVTELGTAYLRGLQSLPANYQPVAGQTIFALATPKHFIGDGGTSWMSSKTQAMNVLYRLDQGDTQMDEATLRRLFLPPYQAAIDAGALSVMASFSSWNGVKVHGQKILLTDLLKQELGFQGFVISDWQAVDQIDPDYAKAVTAAINAGVDMVMVPYDYVRFIQTMQAAVASNAIPQERVDDAVRRILRAKFALGLFEQPNGQPNLAASVRSQEHLALAREAVAKSAVLLKNDGNTLPLAKDLPVIFVAGKMADDIGAQSGGWTLEWQGKLGNHTPGTSLLTALREAVGPETQIEYKAEGRFDAVTDASGQPVIADVAIVVLGETPYAEGVGDRSDLALTFGDVAILERVRARAKQVVVILLSGRPLVITKQLPLIDALVAAWWPGTEGAGVADVLFGDQPFTGKLPYTWPRASGQLPLNINNLEGRTGCEGPLFPFGYGLSTAETSPEILDCP